MLTGEGHENTVYELSGPPRTYDDLASELAAVLGREVPVQHVDDAAYADSLRKAGLPEPAVAMIVGIQQAIRQGALDVESEDFARVLGRPLTPIRDALREMIGR